ncbi:MAG: serine/threonine protein kinase [Polyangiales bacterium]
MAQPDLDASANELLGTQIGPYTLVRRLGMGGMAETFVAIRRGPSGFSQRVCLKLVLPFFREDEEFVRLFQREARLAAKLRHSNIVGVIDFGEIAGRSYMALELVDGVDLQVLLDAESGNRLSPEYVALLGHDLAAALDHAHNPPPEIDSAGSPGAAIVHRDISPSNVLISRHGEIMLSDFGVAKAVTGTARQQSAVKGKIPYMSPEQLRLESLDGRADLFGVGVVLFEALCGKRPYAGGHDPATILLILQGDHEPLASLAPGAPPELCALIESLIEPDRENRPESAAALVELLDPFVPTPRVRRQLGKRVAELRPPEESVSEPPSGFGEQATALQSDVDATGGEQASSGIVNTGRSQQRSPAPAGEPEPVVSEEHITDTLPQRRRNRGLWISILALLLLVAAGVTWRATRDSGPVAAEPSAVETAAVAPSVDEPPADKPALEEPPDAEPDAPASTAQVDGEANSNGGSKDAEQEAQSAPPKPKRKAAPVALAPASLTVVVFPWGDVWINGKPRGSAPLKSLSLKPGRYEIGAGQGKPTVTQTIRLRPGQQKRLRLDVTK